MLKEEFNWPPKRRGKGSKKQAKQKKEMNLSEYKAIYIQKFKDKIPKTDADLISLLKPWFQNFIRYYIPDAPHCPHDPIR
jgi:hypothetical protein